MSPHLSVSFWLSPTARFQRFYRTDQDLIHGCHAHSVRFGQAQRRSDTIKQAIENKHDEALWTANKAQAALQNDNYVCGQIRMRFLQKKKPSMPKDFTVDAVSKATGIIPSTIRYWDKIGLISASRCTANNYRTFTQTHIDEVLIIQAALYKLCTQIEKNCYDV